MRLKLFSISIFLLGIFAVIAADFLFLDLRIITTSATARIPTVPGFSCARFVGDGWFLVEDELTDRNDGSCRIEANRAVPEFGVGTFRFSEDGEIKVWLDSDLSIEAFGPDLPEEAIQSLDIMTPSAAMGMPLGTSKTEDGAPTGISGATRVKELKPVQIGIAGKLYSSIYHISAEDNCTRYSNECEQWRKTSAYNPIVEFSITFRTGSCRATFDAKARINPLVKPMFSENLGSIPTNLGEFIKSKVTKEAEVIAQKLADSGSCELATANNKSSASQSVSPPAGNTFGPSPYSVCAIKCLDEVDRRYQCPLPSTIIDDQGLSVIKLPDGTTRAFSPSGNECVDDRSKAQNDCLSGCPASVGGEPIPDPMGDGQPIKVAGTASDDPLNEAEKYINLLKRKPALPSKEEDLKKILGDYEAGKPMSVWSVVGEPEMQVPGSDEWVILKKGDAIPKGARIFTGMDDDILVVLPGSYVVKVRGFSDITFNQTGISKALGRELINHLDLRNGDVEVQVEKGTYQGSMQVQMPQMVAGVRGTHFWVSYDETKRLGAVGVYKGEVAVDDLFRGTRTLLTPAKDETPRVIVMSSADSASAQDQKSAQGNPQLPAQKQSSSGAWWIVLIIVLGGGVFVLEKTGKLQLMLQKILILIRKDKSKQF